MEKYYVYRVIAHNGHKTYKRTKCTDSWVDGKEKCWQFSKQGAKRIVETYNSHSNGYFTYGIEPVIEIS